MLQGVRPAGQSQEKSLEQGSSIGLTIATAATVGAHMLFHLSCTVVPSFPSNLRTPASVTAVSLGHNALWQIRA